MNSLFRLCSASLYLLAITMVVADSGIEVISTFTYPRPTAKHTMANGIASSGNLVGTFFVDHQGTLRQYGFERYADGSFSAPIFYPGSSGGYASDINSSGLICGVFYMNDARHGFHFDGQSYTPFDIAGAADTDILGENDAGDFVGAYTRPLPPFFGAFADITGVLTEITVLDSTDVTPFDINQAGEITGEYLTSDFKVRSFFRGADGSVVAPINFPNDDAAETSLFSINDQRWMVGEWVGFQSGHHGMVFHLPDKFIAFDYPRARETGFTGINNSGLISGYYIDLNGYHGFTAQLQP